MPRLINDFKYFDHTGKHQTPFLRPYMRRIKHVMAAERQANHHKNQQNSNISFASGAEGRRFESCRAHQAKSILQ
jgi:hypothetical protein